MKQKVIHKVRSTHPDSKRYKLISVMPAPARSQGESTSLCTAVNTATDTPPDSSKATVCLQPKQQPFSSNKEQHTPF